MVYDLSADPRTSGAYAGSVLRGAADPRIGIPHPRGPAAGVLLQTLGAEEKIQWLSWAYELKEEGDTTWWMVALSTKRLIGVSPTATPHVWAAAAWSWTTSVLGVDVVLHLPGGAPLRVRGSAEARYLLRPGPSAVNTVTPIDEPLHTVAAEGERRAASVAAGTGTGEPGLSRRAARELAGRRPRRPRRRRVRRGWVGFAPPATIWDMADRCIKCSRPLTDPRSRQARVGTKCIRIYGSQQRRIPNPSHTAWRDKKARADITRIAEKARADAEFANAKVSYEQAMAEWRRLRSLR